MAFSSLDSHNGPKEKGMVLSLVVADGDEAANRVSKPYLPATLLLYCTRTC